MLSVLVLSVCGAVGISALCSLFEAVLYSLSMSHIELMARQGRRSAEVLKRLKEDIDEPITAILTLNTIAHTVGAAVAGAAAVSVFGENNLIWFSVLFTLAILIFSEILPKTIGVVYCRALAPFIAQPLAWMILALKPVIALCLLITRLIPQRKGEAGISAEELQAIAGLSRQAGEIGEDQERVIINILQLKDKTVRQAMTPRTVIFTLPAAMRVGEAISFRDKWSMHTRVPLFGEGGPDDITGIAISKDVFMAAVEGKMDLSLGELQHEVYFVPEIVSLDRAMLMFFTRRSHLLVVVDEYGSVTGVLSLEDIIEEIIGREIVDESDRARDMRELARYKNRLRQQHTDRA